MITTDWIILWAPSIHSLNLNHRVVIRDAAFGIAHAAFDERIALGPMRLDVAGGDRRDATMAAEFADLAAHENRVAVLQSQPSRVGLIHQHVVAARAVERVAVAVDDAVELFAAPCRETQLPIVCR